ncbi:MAG: AAA family ATPase [Caldilineaceae bacterium]|nr:AAA family ATPase [Caldilineaceae bacterium]
MNITQFTIEEVRCFAERQTFEIRPLTFLVGENSTGKTTALACFHVLADFLSGKGIDFNSDPYSMGVFRDIVRRSMKPEKSFSLGIGFGDRGGDVELTVEFIEKTGGLEPSVESIDIRFADGRIVLRSVDDLKWRFDPKTIDEEGNQYHLDVDTNRLSGDDPFFPLIDFINKRMDEKSQYQRPFSRFLREKMEKGYGFLSPGYDPIVPVFSTSPVRSRPKRTYDPTREFQDPEGSDVPMRLMRIAATKPKEWEDLKHQLVNYGKSSGLFQSIEVKNLGGSLGAPFQLKVKIRGPNSNIVDVGYGVSQILPILVYAMDASLPRPRYLNRESKAFFLLQQPEVHLHPKAQAELSSFLAQLARLGRQSFIIETHSDYLVDRARIEIRRGNVRSDDVSLIFLEPKRNKVKVHNISFDKMGNMIGVPPKFRDFFLQESSRLMGFED